MLEGLVIIYSIARLLIKRVDFSAILYTSLSPPTYFKVLSSNISNSEIISDIATTHNAIVKFLRLEAAFKRAKMRL